MDSPNTQLLFFQHIRSLLPSHVSLADEIADLLKISTDSAYRRIRGEKGISMEEMQILASNYKISIDQFLHIQVDSFLFSGRLANSGDFSFVNWLGGVLQQVEFFNSFSKKHVYYLAKDLPLMHQFLVPELLAFKSFLWRKSILHIDQMRHLQFSIDGLDPAHWELGQKIVAVYNQVPSTEIWNIESINSTIRQIEFYREVELFKNESEIKKLYDSVLKIVDHLEKQAECGLKSRIGETPSTDAAAYHMFNNELVLGDNTIMAELGDVKMVFLTHNTLNFISTRDELFCNYTQGALKNLVSKSTQLSRVGEKERLRFFNRIREKIKLAARL